MSRVSGVILLVLLSAFARAQEWAFELWHEGKIILTSEDTLRGLVKYDLQQDLVQFSLKDEKRVEAYAPRKVLMFEIFDATVKSYRNFYSLPYSSTTSYGALSFFELLTEGKLTLLCREALEYRTTNSPYYYGSFSRLELVYRYFILDEKGKITEFSGRRPDLMALMGRHSDTVDKYMKSNRLRLDNKYHIVRIFAYYNSLF
ncbi:hypothetical protein QQ054_06580 [Oscillatoria amoena NRMC-F 0135]|nr:hypothetical protein [Oscillatoria amoena NRMC-F 0135]